MATDDPGLNSNGLTTDEQATFEGLYGAEPGAAPTEPKPGALAGWWHAAGAVPHALANVGLDLYGATNTALGNAVHGVTQKIEDWHNDDFSALANQPEGAGMGTPFKAAPDYLPEDIREHVDQAQAETAQQVGDLRSTVDQDYRPDPHTTGAAGNLLFGAVDPLVRIGVGSLLTRGAGGLEFAAGSQGYERTQELEAQGVDPSTAAASGAISAGTFEAMGAVGGEGSLASRVLKSGAVNFAGGVANRGADSEVLKAAGYDKLAAQEQWNDAQTMISDALVGLAFPLVHEGINRTLDAAATHSENNLADKITANPDLFDKLHDGTGYVPAANVDAALTSLNARHAADVAPGIPTDFASQGLHYKALDAAIKQVANGDDVYVDPIVRDMNTIPRPVPEGKAEGFAEALAPEPEADPFRYAERDEGGAVTGYRNGENFIPAFKNLTDAQREVEARAAGQVLDDPEAAITAYSALTGKDRDTQGGNLINTDNARELFPDYNAGPEARSMNALAVHEPASWIAKQAWQRALARAPREGKDNMVFFTGGGTGAGKSTGPKRIPELASRQEGADIIFDGNLNGFDSARKKIDAALASGRKAHILYTFRDPAQAFIHGALPRAGRADYGRTVPIPVHVDTHVGAAETYLRLKKHYANDSRVTIQAIHNDYEPGVRSEVRPVSDADVAQRAAADRGILASEVRDAFERERQAGRVTDRVYHGTLGTRPGPEGNGTDGLGGVVRSTPEIGPLGSGSGGIRPESGSATDLNPAAGGVSASGADASIRSSDAAYGTPDRHPWVELDTTKNIPLAGGVSADGKTIYISPYMPKTVDVDGKTIDAEEGVVVHEVEEQKVMLPDGPKDAEYMAALKADIASEAEANPNSPKISNNDLKKVARGVPLPYPKAHTIATIRENAFIRKKYGIDPEKYQHALADGIEEARKKAAQDGNIPADLDRTPYEDTGLTKLLPNKPGGTLMQNRDRARAASLTQMAGIANAPDAQRLGFSRDPNTGAPMVSAENAGEAVPDADQGKEDVVIFADGRKVPVRYAVVDAEDVAASHRADGTVNPDYEGAPLQALNNGRVAGVQAAWTGGKADTYKAGLIADAGLFGIDPKAIADKAQPMVIRLYDAKANFGDMGKASNESGSLGLSPSEQALTDARALPDLDSLPLTESGDISNRADDPFHRAFLRNLGVNDAAKLVDSSGRFNKTYLDRLRAALFARAYGDPHLIEMQTEATDPVARNVLNGLTAAAPEWAKVDTSAPLGDYAGRLTAAMDLLRQARESGETVAQKLAQGDLIARDHRGDAWATFFAGNARSPKLIGEALRDAARMIVAEQRRLLNGDLLGGGGRDESDITKTVLKLAEDRYGHQQPAQSGSLFNAAGRPAAGARDAVRLAGDAQARPAADVARDRPGEPDEGERAAAGDATDGQPAATAQPEGGPARGAVADASNADETGSQGGAAGEARPGEPGRDAQDQEGRAGTGTPSAGDRDVARAREAVARRPDLILPEGLTAAEAMRQADEEVAQAERDAAALKAAVDCFLQFGSDAA